MDKKQIDPKKYRTVTQKAKLYPQGVVEQRQIDSLKRNVKGAEKLIGEPVKREGQIPQYGEGQSDIIKQLLK